MTTENISYGTLHVNNGDITGIKDLIIGDSNQIHGSYDEAKGSDNVIYGRNTTVIGDRNDLEDATGGKLFITGSHNSATISEGTDITLHGSTNAIYFVGTGNTHSEVHGFIKGSGGDEAFVFDDKISFSYHGQNTLMTLGTGNQHSDVLFTNVHLTRSDVIKLEDPL